MGPNTCVCVFPSGTGRNLKMMTHGGYEGTHIPQTIHNYSIDKHRKALQHRTAAMAPSSPALIVEARLTATLPKPHVCGDGLNYKNKHRACLRQ